MGIDIHINGVNLGRRHNYIPDDISNDDLNDSRVIEKLRDNFDIVIEKTVAHISRLVSYTPANRKDLDEVLMDYNEAIEHLKELMYKETVLNIILCAVIAGGRVEVD